MSATLATDVLGYLLERSVTFAVVFAVVGALWLLFQKRLGPALGSLWFLLPLVVLVLPVERWIPNPWTSANPLERAAVSVMPAGMDRVLVDPTTEGFLDFSGWQAPETGAIAAAPDDGARSLAGFVAALPSLPIVAFAAWLLGLALFLAGLVRAQRVVPRLLASATRLEPDRLPLDFESLRRSAGVRDELVLFESPEFESPAVWTGSIPHANSPGRSAALILPEGLVGRLSPDELRWVLLHELAHLARRDNRTELVQRILGAAFFFHPLVWVSNRLVRAYREMACDDAALARCSEDDRPRCARALFEVVAHATALAGRTDTRPRTPLATASLFHSKQLIRKRIMRLVELDRPLSRGLRAGAALPILLASAAALSAARFPAVSIQAETIEEDFAMEEVEEVERESDPRSVAMRAVDWLRRAQDENGGWSYAPPAPEDAESAGAGSFSPLHSDVALTGLAIQALLAANALDPSDAETAAAIARGTAYLLSIQDEELGLYGSMDNPSFMIGQALATEALARAWVGDMNEERTRSLQSAVSFLDLARNPYAGWRYSYPANGENDARVTGYVLLALSAAHDAGAHTSPEAFASGMHYLAELEEPETGRTFYMRGEPYAFRLAGRHESFPAERAEVPTAMHMRLRSIAGLAPYGLESMRLAKRVLAASPPVWDPEHGTIDYNYWWQGTLALAGAEPRGAAWELWSSSLLSALAATQITSGPMAGTWPTVDAWSEPGLEVYTAATNAISLFALVEGNR